MAAIALIGLMPVGCGTNQADTPSVSSAPAPTTSRAQVTMSPAGWCISVGQHLVSAQRQIDIFLKHSDGSRTSRKALADVIATLQHDEDVAPAEFKPKIAEVRRPLETYQRALNSGQNLTVELETYRSMSIDIVMSCGQYLPD
ncbi:hypothetical protein [Spirillospora sp. CA-294931]|uniref:hypothetical protein n=1 Tax=Spirillospora sp. CA-294931 TaxID=3240042 RepID=UPI003D8D049F